MVDPVAVQNLRWPPNPHDVEVACQDAVMLESVQPGIDVTGLGVKGHDPAQVHGVERAPRWVEHRNRLTGEQD